MKKSLRHPLRPIRTFKKVSCSPTMVRDGLLFLLLFLSAFLSFYLGLCLFLSFFCDHNEPWMYYCSLCSTIIIMLFDAPVATKIFEYFFLSGTKWPQPTLCGPCPKPNISQPPKEPWDLGMGTGFRTQDLNCCKMVGSRWTWSTSLSTDTSGIHLQTQKCMQNSS